VTNDDDDFEALAADFRGEVETPLAPAEIVAAAARDARARALRWAQQAAGTLFAVGVFVALVVRTRSLTLTVFAALVVPTLVASFGWFVHLDAEGGRADLRTLRDHAEAALARRRVELRIETSSRGVLAFLIVAFWAWYPFQLLAHGERFVREPWRVVVGTGVSVVVFALAWVIVARRIRRTRAAVTRAEENLAALG
jgi:hypothetical protein